MTASVCAGYWASMSKRPKPPEKSSADKALRAAFKAVEAQPVPEALNDHLDRLVGAGRRPDRRS